MKQLFIYFTLVFVFTNCADLRTKNVKKAPNEKKAAVLLHQMGKAHGISNWDNIKTYTVNLEDVFLGKIGKQLNPYPNNKTAIILSYIPSSFDGQITFKSGDWINKTWGIQSWKTYELISDTTVCFKKNKDFAFWLPTYQYFIEFPNRIQDANAIAYAGEKTIDGKNCEGVLASWKTTKPQRKTDQYLIWIEKETKRIYKLEYTIRDYYSFLKGAIYFKEYKTYNGILIPTYMPAESNLVKNGFLHEMRIKNITVNKIPVKKLKPNNALFEDEKAKH